MKLDYKKVSDFKRGIFSEILSDIWRYMIRGLCFLHYCILMVNSVY